MRSQAGPWLRLLALLSLAAAPAYAQTQPSPEDEVRAAARAFGEALARGDSTAALALLDADVLIHEGGHAETKEQYRSGHLRADMAFVAAVQSETLRDAVTVAGDVALYTRRHRMTGRFRERDIDRTGEEAMVLVRTADGWRILHVHWS